LVKKIPFCYLLIPEQKMADIAHQPLTDFNHGNPWFYP
jgi:hypothetical protein